VLPLLISCSHRAPRVAAADSGVSLDTFVEPPSPLDAADARSRFDLASTRDEGDAEEIPTTEDATTCQPLAYSGGTVLALRQNLRLLPGGSGLPECKSSDVGATVYRDEACALATHQAHSDCSSPWQRAINQEYVIIIDRVWRMRLADNRRFSARLRGPREHRVFGNPAVWYLRRNDSVRRRDPNPQRSETGPGDGHSSHAKNAGDPGQRHCNEAWSWLLGRSCPRAVKHGEAARQYLGRCANV